MNRHAPLDYICPICLGVKGVENDDTLIIQTDIVFRDEDVMAFVSSFFIGNNPGHLVVVPNDHYENLYEIPVAVGHRIFETTKRVAEAVRSAYECEGITTLQNNEPAGNQHAYHYHQHVFPRYEDDDLHAQMMNKELTDSAERRKYAELLRPLLN